jgi:glucosamine--fructose-6-phosphate aminotransferase (isomerizing)
MCGIVGFTGEQSAAPILLDGLKKLEYRGYDSAGIAVMDKGCISVNKVTGRIANLCEKTRDGAAVQGSAGIGHTRWATHGAPTEENAHPHLSNDGRFAVVHNGIIENYLALRDELIKDGYHFDSETDTEVIVHLIEMYYKGDMRDALIRTTNRLRGSYALGVICSEEPGKLYAAREASPLILGVGVDENYFASDVTALVNYTRNVIYLEDGEFAELSENSVKVFDCLGNPVEKKVSRILWDVQAAEKGGYEHFMLKEIMEQPGAVKATISPRIKDGKIVFEELKLTAKDLLRIRKIVITACGSAYYAGCAARYALERISHIPVEVELASELRYSDPMIDSHTLLIVISQSGETADTIDALKECKARGAKTLAIVNVVGSTVAKLADNVIYTWAGPEIAVATTKGYTTQVALLYMFAVYAAKVRGTIDREEYATCVDAIKALPEQAQRAVDINPDVAKTAKKYYDQEHIFFIGRNIDYAVSLEGSLKLKEISYLHSEAYPAGELKHGPIALINDGRLVVALCCYDELFDKMLSNIKEVRARGARVLAVAAEGDDRVLSEADDVIRVPAAHELFGAIGEVVPLQLFAYYVARENGCSIDKPKNLAKSVTVE